MKKVFIFFDIALNRFVPYINSIFIRQSFRHSIVFILLLLVFGQVINYFQPFKHFHLYQLLVTSAIIIASWAIKKFLIGMNEFKQMIASHPLRFVGINIIKLINSKWSIPGLIIIGGLFVYSSFRLEYVRFNLIGLYALVMIIIMMITAIFGQTIYVYFIILLDRISNEKKFKYNFYIPAKTDWIVHLAKVARMLINSFFFLGLIYTIVYYLNMPRKAITFDHLNIGNFYEQIQISTPDNTIFVISWVTIFMIIIVAFPIYYLIQNSYIKTLIRRLKDQSIEDIQKLMKAQELTGTENIDLELKYFTLINNIENSPSKPLEDYNLIPLITSLSSICIHFIKISESLM